MANKKIGDMPVKVQPDKADVMPIVDSLAVPLDQKNKGTPFTNIGLMNKDNQGNFGLNIIPTEILHVKGGTILQEPGTPILNDTNNIGALGGSNDIVISGKFVYIASTFGGGSMLTFEITNPDKPTFVDDFLSLGGTNSVQAAGDLVYISNPTDKNISIIRKHHKSFGSIIGSVTDVVKLGDEVQ